MNETKFWLQSNTVRGILIAALPTIYAIAKAMGLDLPDGALEQVVDGVAALLSVIGLVVAFVGRHKAEKPLGYSK